MTLLVLLLTLLVIPRLKSRGPIEAMRPPLRTGPGRLIPRLKSRGPIEAEPGPVRFAGYADIPRLKSRGPIEAPRRILTSGGASTPFRG